jgi:hypothetical protein
MITLGKLVVWYSVFPRIKFDQSVSYDVLLLSSTFSLLYHHIRSMSFISIYCAFLIDSGKKIYDFCRISLGLHYKEQVQILPRKITDPEICSASAKRLGTVPVPSAQLLDFAMTRPF